MPEKSSFFPDCFHRVTIKGLCVRDGKVLLIQESNKKWEMPGGGLDFGEDIKTALRREVEEEMKLKIVKISDKPVYVWTHRYPPNSRNIGWYYSLVLAYQIEFENLDFTSCDECEALEFFTKDQLRDLKYAGQTAELINIFNPKDFEGEF